MQTNNVVKLSKYALIEIIFNINLIVILNRNKIKVENLYDFIFYDKLN
jgi:hypothetical protein